MNEDQRLEKVAPVRRPWTEAWEQAWEAYQGQNNSGGDAELASFVTVRRKRMMPGT